MEIDPSLKPDQMRGSGDNISVVDAEPARCAPQRRFVQCQSCGRLYYLPLPDDRIGEVLAIPGGADISLCYVTRKHSSEGDILCQSRIFREISPELARSYHEAPQPVVPEWYLEEFFRLMRQPQAAKL